MALTMPQRILAGVSLMFVVLAVFLASQYFDALGQRAALQKRLATLQSTVDTINAANGSADSADPLLRQAAFPPNPPNLDLASLVLNSAGASGVTTGTIQATTQGTEKIGANTYRTVSLSLSVNGTFLQVLNFFDLLQSGGMKTLAFDNIHLEPTNSRWTVQLQVTAYAQPG